MTRMRWFRQFKGPILKKAVAKAPVPEYPEPLAVDADSIKLLCLTTTSVELTMVWFEPVSKTSTAGLPLTSALINTKPNLLLYAYGISTGPEELEIGPVSSTKARNKKQAYR